MWTTIVQVALAPAARLAFVQVRVPAASAQAGLLAETKLVPAGTASVSVKPALSEGPRLSTLTVKVSSVPAVAGSGAAVLVTLRSAERLTVVAELELLLPPAGSEVALVSIAAVFVSVPPSVLLGPVWTTIVQVALAPAARPELMQVPAPAAPFPYATLFRSKLVPAGTASVSVKPALSEGPRLSTLTVKVSSVPARSEERRVGKESSWSAARLTVVAELELVLPRDGSEGALVSIRAVFVSVPT